MLFKNKNTPEIIQVFQWFKNGDHPKDQVLPTVGPRGKLWYSEGKIVNYFKSKGTGLEICLKCNHIMNHHGNIDHMVVHPGDYIHHTDENGYYPIPEYLILEYYDRID